MREFFPQLLKPGKSNTRYADAADFLRVISVFIIAWYHIWQQSWLNPSFTLGTLTVNLRDQVATGYLLVDLMLLISGFLLYLPYAGGRECRVREFYIRRGLRILPSYWFSLAVMLFAFALPQGQFPDSQSMWKDVLSHLTFTHTFFYETYITTRLNVVLWTLAVEVQFYLIFPLLARAFRRRPALVYCVMLTVTQAFRYYFVRGQADTNLWVNQLPNMLEIYANGMLAAHLYVHLSKRGPQRNRDAWLSTVLAAAALVMIWFLMEDQGRLSDYEQIRAGQMERRFLLSFAGSVFLVCGSRSVRGLRALLSNRLVVFLSGVSFNFYIWHQVLAVKLKLWKIPGYLNDAPHKAGEQPWQLQYTLLCFLAAFALSVLLTYLLEKPAARLGRKLFSRGK